MGSDRLLRNARLVGGGAEPVDVLIAESLVAAIRPAGSPAEPVETVELDGGWLLPGLADRHVHLTQWAKTSRRVDLSRAGSAAEAASLAVDALAGGASEVVGYGFRDGLWPDTPLVADLDAVTGERPVVLVSGDLHCAWLNSAALRRYGLSGYDGLVREDPAFAVLAHLENSDDATADAHAVAALRAAAARGITAVTDFEMVWGFDAWPRRAASGPLPVRVDVGFYSSDLDRALDLGLHTGELIPGAVGRATVGPLKVITDGSLNTRTAWCVDPYPGLEDAEHPSGVSSVPPEELLPLLARAHAGGLQAAVHAIGDRANQEVLNAFAATGARGSVEHAQLLRREDIPRFTELGLVASVQPEHAMDDRDVADRHWAGRTDRAFLLADLHRAGCRLALGSDAPVAPLDPWIAIAAAVTRSRDGRDPWHAEQALDIAAAIASSTDGVGVVTEGIAADLVVVDLDPYTATGEQLRTMPVRATMLAGEWTYGP